MSKYYIDKPTCGQCGRLVDEEFWECDEPGCEASAGDCCNDDWQEGDDQEKCWCPAHVIDEEESDRRVAEAEKNARG